MIRINLLPVRAAKKKESIRFQLTVAVLITAMVVTVSSAYYLKLKSDVSMLKEDIDTMEEELRKLKRKVGELTKIKEQKKLLQNKLDVVNKLEKARTGPVAMFIQISEAIPKKVWLISLTEKGKNITLNGNAVTDEDLAEFMRRLEAVEDIKKVELVVAKRTKAQGVGLDIVSFTLNVERK